MPAGKAERTASSEVSTTASSPAPCTASSTVPSDRRTSSARSSGSSNAANLPFARSRRFTGIRTVVAIPAIVPCAAR